MITFAQLTPNSSIHIIETVGTFRKSTYYYVGNIANVSAPYDEPQAVPYTPPTTPKKRLVDITITCNGEQKKLSVPEDKSIISDSQIGLTVSINKQDVVNQVLASYNEFKAKKEMMLRYLEEMERCEDILAQLDYDPDPKKVEESEERKEINTLKNELEELKNALKANIAPTQPQMQQQMPQQMQPVPQQQMKPMQQQRPMPQPMQMPPQPIQPQQVGAQQSYNTSGVHSNPIM